MQAKMKKGREDSVGTYTNFPKNWLNISLSNSRMGSNDKKYNHRGYIVLFEYTLRANVRVSSGTMPLLGTPTFVSIEEAGDVTTVGLGLGLGLGIGLGLGVRVKVKG